MKTTFRVKWRTQPERSPHLTEIASVKCFQTHENYNSLVADSNLNDILVESWGFLLITDELLLFTIQKHSLNLN